MKSLVFREFSGRTATCPIRTLLYFGWELEFGWQAVEDSGYREQRIVANWQEVVPGKGAAVPGLCAVC
jgi:hypothetical protein